MYERIIQKALNTPWAMLPSKLAIVQRILLERHSGIRPSADEIRARLGYDPDEQEKPKPRQNGQIAVLPVHGVIANRTFEASSGATSAEWIGSVFRRLLTSEDIAAIVLDFSSPGGTVDGVPELAAEIFAARQVKPIVAHVNSLAASAGYWLASQCSEISCIQSGEVGSIGVYSLHEDWSEHLAKEGIKIIAISAGDHKLDGAPWAPLSEEALAHFQSQVDDCYAQFLAAVARGREVSVADVKANFGQGWCFDAKKAKKLGMIDRIETFEQLVVRLSAKGKRGAARAQALVFRPFADEDGMLGAVGSGVDVQAGPLAEAPEGPCACSHDAAEHNETAMGWSGGSCNAEGCDCKAWTTPESADLAPAVSSGQVDADRDRARAKVAIARARLA